MSTPTHTIKQGDTGPALKATLTGADGSAQDLTGAAVKFNMTKGAEVVIDHASCVVTDAPTGAVEYHWGPEDTAAAGSYRGEFEVTFDDDTIITFPNAEPGFKVKVVAELD